MTKYRKTAMSTENIHTQDLEKLIEFSFLSNDSANGNEKLSKADEILEEKAQIN